MRNVESSMDWMSFSNKMKQVACQLSSSACPMVLVLPDGREIRFTDINVDTFDYKGKRGDTEYDRIGFRVNLLGAEVRNGKDDGSLANSPYGNCAKLREALETLLNLAYEVQDANSEYGPKVCIPTRFIIDEAKSALAAPPRNCDMPLVVDGPADNNADKAWLVFKRHNPDAYFDVSGLLRCIDWLLAPATEKEGEE